MEDLDQLRAQIDSVDEQLVALLNKRAGIAQKVGAAKKSSAKFRPTRESAVIRHAQEVSAGPFAKEAITAVFREVISACLNLEQPMRIAYLGPVGTYSEQAAQVRFGAMATFMQCSDLDEIFRQTEAGNADVAVVPIENSTEGAVNRTLDLLVKTSLGICDEIYLPIHHQLMGEGELEGITEVVAHPQALAQCHDWLARQLPQAKLVSASSNGEAARQAVGEPARAAIASERAASLNGLDILAANIEDDPSNTTRFLVLGTTQTQPSGHDKTSLVWTASNRPGALLDVLAVLAANNINMVKLESRPADSGLWEYRFYTDIDGHCQDQTVAVALKELQQRAASVKVLGSYPRAV